jgi:hypothetical protein
MASTSYPSMACKDCAAIRNRLSAGMAGFSQWPVNSFCIPGRPLVDGLDPET